MTRGGLGGQVLKYHFLDEQPVLFLVSSGYGVSGCLRIKDIAALLLG